MTNRLANFFILSLIWAGSAQAQHFYGSGIQDRDSGAILTLKCLDEQPDTCTRALWVVTLANGDSIDLGKPYSISKYTSDEYEAYLQLDGLGSTLDHRDLESDEFARRMFQQYINGFAKHARKNFKKGGLIRSTNKVFWNGKDISASHFAEQHAGEAKLQTATEKNGWNWSSKAKAVSHSYFSNMIQLVAMRALESAQKKSVQGEQSLKNYVDTIRNERMALQMLREHGMAASASGLEHFSNGNDIVIVLARLGVEPQ